MRIIIVMMMMMMMMMIISRSSDSDSDGLVNPAFSPERPGVMRGYNITTSTPNRAERVESFRSPIDATTQL